jgi:hypothetical protein
MTGSGGMLQPDIRQGRCHGKKSRRAKAAACLRISRQPGDEDDGKSVFKDGDSHVWTGSGCGYGLV